MTPSMGNDYREAVHALDELDRALHQKVRLGIMSTLLALGKAEFRLLKETLTVSDGNLATHLAQLEERGYITVEKEFVRRKPRSTYFPTEAGRAAFQQYVAALERIVRATTNPSLLSSNEIAETSRRGRAKPQIGRPATEG